MLLKASTDFRELAMKAESALGDLGLQFRANRTSSLVEFEIDSPGYFRVVIESRSDPEIRNNLLLPSISKAKGCTIDIRYGLDSDAEHLSMAEEEARRLVKELASKLDKEPWEGLRFRESGAEKKKWREFTSSGKAESP